MFWTHCGALRFFTVYRPWLKRGQLQPEPNSSSLSLPSRWSSTPPQIKVRTDDTRTMIHRRSFTHFTHGCGSKLNHQRPAGFSPCLHLPGFRFGYLFLTHTHMFQDIGDSGCSRRRHDPQVERLGKWQWTGWHPSLPKFLPLAQTYCKTRGRHQNMVNVHFFLLRAFFPKSGWSVLQGNRSLNFRKERAEIEVQTERKRRKTSANECIFYF